MTKTTELEKTDEAALIETLAQLSGVPEDSLRQQISEIVDHSSVSSEEDLTLESLRAALLEYLSAMDAAESADMIEVGAGSSDPERSPFDQ